MSKFFLYITVFITGMAVTAIELTASRLLAPYFGASLFIWTNIIGVVLLALSLGYYIGGKLADKNSGGLAKKIMYPLIFVTGILIAIIPFVGKPIFLFAYSAISQRDISLFFSSLLATFVLFTIPIFILGMISPLAARLGLNKMEDAGKTLGSIYAFSTLGSIVGTFLPVLVTIPFLGTRETFFIFGGLLILLGIIGMKRAIFLPFILIPVVFFFVPSSIHASPYLEYEGESIYNYIRVEKNDAGVRALKTNEGQGVQSLYQPYRTLTGYYWDAASFLPVVNLKGKDFLIIGTAGLSSARILNNLFPFLNLSGVEIDPLMIEVAQKYFDLDKIPININVGDGRVFLRNFESKYDFIMVDVYKDELYIPFHLATSEFFELVKSRLNNGGGMVMNIASTSVNSELLSVIKNTVAGAFPYVYQYTTPKSYNTLIYAFNEKPDFSAIHTDSLPLTLRTIVSPIIKNISKIDYNPAEYSATDNKSSIELLTEKMVFSEVLHGN